jgi:hypothetical protein
MPKWKKGATEFTVSVNHNEVRGYQTSIPKPIMELLGEPGSITFIIKGDKKKIIELTGEKKPKKAFK